MIRALLPSILSDLERKMVFLTGPRQVGKTTLARQALARLSPEDPVYLNWDRAVDFLLLKEGKPWVLVEAKAEDLHLNPALPYFRDRLRAPFAFQVVAGTQSRQDIVPAARFFAALP